LPHRTGGKGQTPRLMVVGLGGGGGGVGGGGGGGGGGGSTICQTKIQVVPGTLRLRRPRNVVPKQSAESLEHTVESVASRKSKAANLGGMRGGIRWSRERQGQGGKRERDPRQGEQFCKVKTPKKEREGIHSLNPIMHERWWQKGGSKRGAVNSKGEIDSQNGKIRTFPGIDIRGGGKKATKLSRLHRTQVSEEGSLIRRAKTINMNGEDGQNLYKTLKTKRPGKKSEPFSQGPNFINRKGAGPVKGEKKGN